MVLARRRRIGYDTISQQDGRTRTEIISLVGPTFARGSTEIPSRPFGGIFFGGSVRTHCAALDAS